MDSRDYSVWIVIRRLGGASPGDVARRTGIDEVDVEASIGRLCDAGQVERKPWGWVPGRVEVPLEQAAPVEQQVAPPPSARERHGDLTRAVLEQLTTEWTAAATVCAAIGRTSRAVHSSLRRCYNAGYVARVHRNGGTLWQLTEAGQRYLEVDRWARRRGRPSVEETLRRLGRATVPQLLRHTGLARSTVHSCLRRLGAVECGKQGNFYAFALPAARPEGGQ